MGTPTLGMDFTESSLTSVFCPICNGDCRLNECAFWHEHELTNGKIHNCGIASFMQMYLNTNEQNPHGNHIKHYIDKAGLVMANKVLEDE